MVAYTLPNGAVVLLQALLVDSTPLPVLEIMVVLVGGAVVKLSVALDLFPGDSYGGVSRGTPDGQRGPGRGHELSGRLHRHAQAVADGDGLVGPDALKSISSSPPSEATSKPNIGTRQRKPTASCWLCWSNPSSTAKKRRLNQTLHGGHRSLQFSTLSFRRRTSRCCLGERQRLHAVLFQGQAFIACPQLDD
jgi:hypothetical protein